MRPTDDARGALMSWSQTGEGAAKGIFRFSKELPVFRGHFPGRPLVPGVYQLAAMAEVAARALGRAVEIRFVDRAKWSAPALPEQELAVEIEWYAIDDGFLIDGSLANESGNCATGRIRVTAPAATTGAPPKDDLPPTVVTRKMGAGAPSKDDLPPTVVTRKMEGGRVAGTADEKPTLVTRKVGSGRAAEVQPVPAAPTPAPSPPAEPVAEPAEPEDEVTLSGAYTIEVHRHRFAAWVASRAAAATKDCHFRPQKGVQILEACGIDAALASPDQLPNPAEIDQVHRQYRKALIKTAQLHGLQFSHGVAAMLINCYLKTRFVCAGHHEHERVRCLHPPIDAALLKELEKRDVGGFADRWRKFHEHGWAKFDSETYQGVIDLMRQSLPPEAPLWTIEEYWSGHL